MTTDTEFCLIMTTTDDRSEAESLAQGMVGDRLAACVQITEIKSYFRWEGEVSEASEFLLLVKTARGQYDGVSDYLQANHSYDVPELVELPILRGGAGYLDWVRASTGRGGTGS